MPAIVKAPSERKIVNPLILGLVSALSTLILVLCLEKVLGTEKSLNGVDLNLASPIEVIAISVLIPLLETLVFQTLIILITIKITDSKVINITASSVIFSTTHVRDVTSLYTILEGFLSVIIAGGIFAYISFKNIQKGKIKNSIIYTWMAHSIHNTLFLFYMYAQYSWQN